MATTHVIKGGEQVKWGTEDFTSGQGIVTAVTEDNTFQNEKVENNQGAVVGMCIYDNEKTIKVDIMAKPTAALPKEGDLLATVVTGGDLPVAIITKVTRTRGNKQFMVHSIEAMAWANFTGA